jgi:hypothetical protein
MSNTRKITVVIPTNKSINNVYRSVVPAHWNSSTLHPIFFLHKCVVFRHHRSTSEVRQCHRPPINEVHVAV